MGEQVGATVEFKKGDTSGLDAAEKLQKTVAELRKEVDAAKRAGGLDAIAGDGRGLGRASAQIEEMTGDWRDLRKEILAADKAVEKFSNEVKQIPDARGATAGVGGDISGRGETALTATAGLAGGLGAGVVAERLTIGADVLGFADAIKELRGQITEAVPGLGKLGAQSIAAGAAIGAVGIGIGLLAFAFDSMNKDAKRLKATLDATAEVQRAIGAGLTTEEARERVAALKLALKTEREILQGLEEDLDQAFRDVRAREEGGAARQKALSEAVKETTTSVSEMETELEGYNAALGDGALAANDAAAAEEKLAADRKKATQETIAAMQAAAQTEIDRAGTLRNITVEGAKEQTAALQDQSFHQAALVAQLRNSAKAAGQGTAEYEQFSDAADKAAAELKNTNSSLLFMQTAATQAAKANEKAAQRVEELARAEEEMLKSREKSIQKIKDLTKDFEEAFQEMADASRRSLDDMIQNTRDRARANREEMESEQRSGNFIDDINERLRRRRATRGGERASSAAAADDRLERLERDHQRNLEDIRRKAMQDEFGLTASRDFAGLLRLRRDAKIREDEEKLSFKRRLDDLGVAVTGEQGIQSRLNQIRAAGGTEAARIVGSNTEAINRRIAQLFSGVLDRTALGAPPPGRRTPEQMRAEIAAQNARTRRQVAAAGGFSRNPQMQFRPTPGIQPSNQTINNRTLNATNNFAVSPGVNHEQLGEMIFSVLGDVLGV
jgi:hypothetical protein